VVGRPGTSGGPAALERGKPIFSDVKSLRDHDVAEVGDLFASKGPSQSPREEASRNRRHAEKGESPEEEEAQESIGAARPVETSEAANGLWRGAKP
jgi:hypothetical protein